jgi:septal ring factor EnvC (AmiA/AmiB activator)
LQAQCDQLGAELQGLRAQLAEQQEATAAERNRQEAYVRNLEDRAHQEVDRLRQESKQWQQRLEAAERAHREAERLLQLDQSTLRDQLRSAEQAAARHAGQVAALEKALSETRTKSLPKRPQKKSAQRSGKGSIKKGVDPSSQPS